MKSRLFERFTLWSTWAIFILFFLGGLVRSTGSGMGCPDWPKCFGEWIPPTSEEQLPQNYESIFLEQRQTKVERLVAFLNKMGMTEKAVEIGQASWLFEHDPYNFAKAYTEYVNRLWGAFTGLLVLAALFFSLFLIKTDPLSAVLSCLGFVLVGFNGWLGSLVVDTNLFEGMVTVHFVFAFLAFSVFLLAYVRRRPRVGIKRNATWIAISLILLAMASFQVVAGSLVREGVDSLDRNGTAIGLDNYQILGGIFTLHRISSIIVLALSAYLFRSYLKSKDRIKLRKHALILLVVVILQISSGAANISFSFPAIAQTMHITLGAATFAMGLLICIQELRIGRSAL